MTAEKGANRNEKIDNRKKNCTCIKIKKFKKKKNTGKMERKLIRFRFTPRDITYIHEY